MEKTMLGKIEITVKQIGSGDLEGCMIEAIRLAMTEDCVVILQGNQDEYVIEPDEIWGSIKKRNG